MRKKRGSYPTSTWGRVTADGRLKIVMEKRHEAEGLEGEMSGLTMAKDTREMDARAVLGSTRVARC